MAHQTKKEELEMQVTNTRLQLAVLVVTDFNFRINLGHETRMDHQVRARLISPGIYDAIVEAEANYLNAIQELRDYEEDKG